LDVNVLVYAQRGGTPEHDRIGEWLQDVANDSAPFALATLVLSGALRVLTHPRVFAEPTPLAEALVFVQALRGRPNCVEIAPGPRHWSIFGGLCRATQATGNEIPDAYLAALAIESGSEWITTDAGFSRYESLRWSHPLADSRGPRRGARRDR
jgi:toxin-antitoxin system PIN domain toxin